MAARKVLLVDDADDIRDAYEVVLQGEGYEVRTASRAEAALEILRSWRPDLVITDICMPGIGGLELVTRVRSDLGPPVPPVVVVSGFADARAEALRRGAARFEAKPLGYEELVRLVQDTLDSTRPPRVRPSESIKARRDATRAIGEATLTRYLSEDPDFVSKLTIQAQAVARFFGCGSALVFLLRAGRLSLTASSNPSFAPGADAAEISPLVKDLVETGTSLVLTTSASPWGAHTGGADPIEFLVGVPYLVDRVAVGALCLIDNEPHEFGAGALGMLEYITGRVTSVLRGGPRILDASGLLERDAFAAFVRGGTSIAAEAHHAIGFALFDAGELPSDGSLTTLLANLPGAQLVVGVLDRYHVAALAVAESPQLVRERLALIRREIETRLTVRAISELTYEDPVPLLPPEVFFSRGRELLARALAERAPRSIAFLAMDARRR